MKIVFSWNVISSSIAPSENGMTKVMKSVKVERKGIDINGFSAVFETEVELPSPSPASYTPFDQVSEPMIVQWINETLDPRLIQAYDDEITGQINNLIENNLIRNYPLPWQ
jgi:hypothetical protein